MMGTCSTCKYWDQSKSNKYHNLKGTDQGSCMAILGRDGCHVQDVLLFNVLAEVQAGYDRTGCELVTRGTFGCVLYELKVI